MSPTPNLPGGLWYPHPTEKNSPHLEPKIGQSLQSSLFTDQIDFPNWCSFVKRAIQIKFVMKMKKQNKDTRMRE
jgi:hypothetical protein